MLINPVIIRCPDCHTKMQHFEWLSGNTFGAVRWSDGFQQAPMMPDASEIIRCNKCGAVHWQNKFQQIEDIDENEEYPAPEKPSVDDLMQFLHLKNYRNSDEEKYLRVHIWWKINDLIRNIPDYSEFKACANDFKDNLQQLVEMLNTDEFEGLLKAEAYRELGEFRMCIKILNALRSTPDYGKDHKVIRRKARFRNRKLFEFK